MSSVFVIREVQADDASFLRDMAWETVAVDLGMRSIGREAAFALPDVRHYLEGWGRADRRYRGGRHR